MYVIELIYGFGILAVLLFAGASLAFIVALQVWRWILGA